MAPLIPAGAVTAWQFAPAASGALALAAAAYLTGVRLTWPAWIIMRAGSDEAGS